MKYLKWSKHKIMKKPMWGFSVMSQHILSIIILKKLLSPIGMNAFQSCPVEIGHVPQAYISSTLYCNIYILSFIFSNWKIPIPCLLISYDTSGARIWRWRDTWTKRYTSISIGLLILRVETKYMTVFNIYTIIYS